MFDVAACSAMVMATAPAVNAEALRELRILLTSRSPTASAKTERAQKSGWGVCTAAALGAWEHQRQRRLAHFDARAAVGAAARARSLSVLSLRCGDSSVTKHHAAFGTRYVSWAFGILALNHRCCRRWQERHRRLPYGQSCQHRFQKVPAVR